MHLCTLPRWAALLVAVFIWPFATAFLMYLLLSDGQYSPNSMLAGVLICIFCRQVKKVWRIFNNA